MLLPNGSCVNVTGMHQAKSPAIIQFLVYLTSLNRLQANLFPAYLKQKDNNCYYVMLELS